MRYLKNNDMMSMSLSAVETTCVVEGSTLIEKKKGSTCEVHQMQAPKYYVQNNGTIKYEMPVETTQKKYQ
jgi:hypothetical protein